MADQNSADLADQKRSIFIQKGEGYRPMGGWVGWAAGLGQGMGTREATMEASGYLKGFVERLKKERKKKLVYFFYTKL